MLCRKRRDGYKKNNTPTNGACHRSSVIKSLARCEETELQGQKVKPHNSGSDRVVTQDCPFGVWISPRMENPPPMWAICFCLMTTLTVRKIFHLFEWLSFISGSIHHLLLFPWSPTEKSLRVMFNSHIRYLYILVRHPMRLLQAEQFQLSQLLLKWQLLQ